MKNIMLIGMPGSGKTTLGAMAAKALNLQFIDMDAYIEASLGKKINDIFAETGEGFFRGLESASAAIIGQIKGQIISAGGGFILRENNIDEARKHSVLVFIDRSIEAVSENFNYSDRPLLNTKEALFAMYEARIDKYRKAADYVLDAEGTVEASCEKLCRLIAQIYLTEPKFAVIGNPIAKSLSPQIHLPVLNHYCEEPAYEKTLVLEDELEEFVDFVRKQGIDGFNITMPHKTAIIPYIDILDEDASLLGAVNTVVNKSGRLYGFSTDGDGFLLSLEHEGISPVGKNILIAGAGGAAKAVCYSLAKAGCASVTVLDINTEQAAELCLMLKSVAPELKTEYAALKDIEQFASDADIFINATPLGMEGGTEWGNLDFVGMLPKTAFVHDLLYYPMQTKLMQQAEARGLRNKNGLDMLIFQGIAADELYLGIPLDYEEHYAKIKLLLQRNSQLS